MWLAIDFKYPRVDVSDISLVKDLSTKINDNATSLLGLSKAWTRNGQCCAYVTLATPSYSLGLTVLLRSLRQHSKHPVIVLTPTRWSFETEISDVYFLVVPELVNSKYAPARSEFRVTLTKLWSFSLLAFDRLTFLDTDCVIKKPIDDLFDRKGVWCGPDYVEDANSKRFNSGLISFEPTPSLRDKIFERAPLAESYDHGDQGVLNDIISEDIQILPPEYNAARHFLFYHGAEMKSDKVRMIHYLVKKPWELWYRETPDAALIDAEDYWTTQLTHKELLDLVAHWRRRQFIAERPGFESLRQHSRPHWIPTLIHSSKRIRYFLAVAIIVILLSLLLCSAALVLYVSMQLATAG